MLLNAWTFKLLIYQKSEWWSVIPLPPSPTPISISSAFSQPTSSDPSIQSLYPSHRTDGSTHSPDTEQKSFSFPQGDVPWREPSKRQESLNQKLWCFTIVCPKIKYHVTLYYIIVCILPGPDIILHQLSLAGESFALKLDDCLPKCKVVRYCKSVTVHFISKYYLDYIWNMLFPLKDFWRNILNYWHH